MTYSWVITADHIKDPEAPEGTCANAVGLIGSRSTRLTREQILEHPKREKFLLLDDDGVLYYEGYMVHGPDSSGFEPLTDFGTPNAGATIIRYRNPDGTFSDL